MPGGDRTGPAGMGPMTGRAGGFCSGCAAPGYMNPAVERGYRGRGRGGGFGRGRGAYGLPAQYVNMGAYPPAAPFASSFTPEEELSCLKGQAKYLKDTLDGINKQIEALDSKKK